MTAIDSETRKNDQVAMSPNGAVSTQPATEAMAIDRESLRSLASTGIAKTRRFARRFSFGFALTLALMLIPLDIVAAQHGTSISAVPFMNLFLFILTYYPVRTLLMRDVHQLEKLVKHGVAHRGQLVARQWLPESPFGVPSNMRIEWEERGRRVWAVANDLSDVIKGPVSRDVTVLTRGRKRWVGAVIGEKFLIAQRPPRQYHLWGHHE